MGGNATLGLLEAVSYARLLCNMHPNRVIIRQMKSLKKCFPLKYYKIVITSDSLHG